MEKCKDCQRWLSEYGKDVFCVECPSGVPNNKISLYMKETVVIGDGYKTTRARLDELERRKIIPNSVTKDGEYQVGRRMENGTIAEKEPDYR